MKKLSMILLAVLFVIPVMGVFRADIQDIWDGYIVKDDTNNVYVKVENQYNGNFMCYLDSLTIAADSIQIKAYSCGYDSANTGLIIDSCQNEASWNLNGMLYLAKYIRFEIIGTDQSADSLYFRFRLLKERE